MWGWRRRRAWRLTGLVLGLALSLAGTGGPGSEAAPLRQSGQRINYGDTVSGAITEAEPCRVYWFEGTANDPVTITMQRTGGNLDGTLAVYQQDRTFNPEPLITNDDAPGGGLDPVIEIRLPAGDWYTIEACRLQHEQIITTGTFDLTLTGPDASGGSEETGPPTATPEPLSGGLFDSTPTGAATESGDNDDPGGAAWLAGILQGEAAKQTPTPVPPGGLTIPTSTPAPASESPTGSPGGELVIPTVTPAPASESPTDPAGGLADPCEFTVEPVTGPASSDRLAEVYTAAGDGYTADELTPTAVFHTDDDLNVILQLRADRVPATAAVWFCGPDGTAFDAGEGEMSDTDPVLFGLDWEYLGEAWPVGEWVAAVYLDGGLEIALALVVK